MCVGVRLSNWEPYLNYLDCTSGVNTFQVRRLRGRAMGETSVVVMVFKHYIRSCRLQATSDLPGVRREDRSGTPRIPVAHA